MLQSVQQSVGERIAAVGTHSARAAAFTAAAQGHDSRRSRAAEMGTAGGGGGAEGIAAERIELRGGTSHKEHLAMFNDVDIALDPFPQNGGISTWEALWMGVPVVAKLGNSVPSRISAAILAALGLSDWTAQD